MRIDKIGGTSLGTPSRLQTSLDAVLARPATRRVVVVSAPAGVTDQLVAAERDPQALDRARERCLELCTAVASGAHQQAGLEGVQRAFRAGRRALGQGRRDAWFAAGERASLAIVGAALASRGVERELVDATELVLLDRDGVPDLEAMRRAGIRRLPSAALVVVPGFFGADPRGRVRVLGRGASDYSATLLAAALDAAAVTIWTDTPGVQSADPRLVPGAVPVAELSWAEAGRVATAGAKVVHPQTFEPIRRRGVEMFIADPRQGLGDATKIGSTGPGLASSTGFVLVAAPQAGELRVTLVVPDRVEEWSVASQVVLLARRLGIAAPLGVQVGSGTVHLHLPGRAELVALHDGLVASRRRAVA